MKMKRQQALLLPWLATLIRRSTIVDVYIGPTGTRNFSSIKNVVCHQPYLTLNTRIKEINDDDHEAIIDDQDLKQQIIIGDKDLKQQIAINRRIGGRRKKVRGTIERSSSFANSVNSALSDLLGKNRRIILWLTSAALLWTLFFSRLFGGGVSSSTNYVYYQSSVIESRVIGPDGKVESSRKESFRSNLPDLVRQQRLQQQQQQQNAQSTTEDKRAPFGTGNQQMGRSIDLLIDAEKKYLLDELF